MSAGLSKAVIHGVSSPLTAVGLLILHFMTYLLSPLKPFRQGAAWNGSRNAPPSACSPDGVASINAFKRMWFVRYLTLETRRTNYRLLATR